MWRIGYNFTPLCSWCKLTTYLLKGEMHVGRIGRLPVLEYISAISSVHPWSVTLTCWWWQTAASARLCLCRRRSLFPHDGFINYEWKFKYLKNEHRRLSQAAQASTQQSGYSPPKGSIPPTLLPPSSASAWIDAYLWTSSVFDIVHVSEGAKTASGVSTTGSWSASNGLMCGDCV